MAQGRIRPKLVGNAHRISPIEPRSSVQEVKGGASRRSRQLSPLQSIDRLGLVIEGLAVTVPARGAHARLEDLSAAGTLGPRSQFERSGPVESSIDSAIAHRWFADDQALPAPRPWGGWAVVMGFVVQRHGATTSIAGGRSVTLVAFRQCSHGLNAADALLRTHISRAGSLFPRRAK
ncbi:MAG: hypothetical protein M1823_002227 [Watsoniomyces obsoletus]|nr:MAG: hypothetical protein M1823_002227 [Watsoniomyces obsoletus]